MNRHRRNLIVLYLALLVGGWWWPRSPLANWGFLAAAWMYYFLLYWVVGFFTGIGVGYRREQAAEWRRAGWCGGCGYDLRASAGRCPECGAEPARSPPPPGVPEVPVPSNGKMPQ